MYFAVAVTLLALTQASVPSPADVVRIDVIAADARGRVVANLTAADFELTEDATLQAVEEARFVRIDPANDGRQFAIYLDEYHVSPAGTALVREVLASAPKGAFQTTLTVSAAGPYLAVQALDSTGAVLGTSATVKA